MSKDYANKNRFTRQRKRQESRFVPFTAAILATVCFVGAAVYFIHAYHQSTFLSKEHVTAWFNHAKNIVAKNKSPLTKNLPQTSAPHEEIQFDFYTELPNMQVNFPESAQFKAISIAPRKIVKEDNKLTEVNHLAGQIDESIKTVMAEHVTNKSTATQFIVQLGEFKDQLNASQLRLSLLLAGIETQIVKTANHTFRVQRGPYANERQAKSAERLLNKKGFDGLIKKIDSSLP